MKKGDEFMADLTLKETASRWGVSVDTVRRRIRNGLCNAHKDTQGRWLVSSQEADRLTYVDKQATSKNDSKRLEQVVSTLTEELRARRLEVQQLHLLLQQALSKS
jgi:DNA-directed RNA polymerase specialized sigma24 family protein